MLNFLPLNGFFFLKKEEEVIYMFFFLKKEGSHLHVLGRHKSNLLQEWTIDMTGQISPTKRAGFWKTKRVFFVTPQVLEKDIQSGESLNHSLIFFGLLNCY